MIWDDADWAADQAERARDRACGEAPDLYAAVTPAARDRAAALLAEHHAAVQEAYDRAAESVHDDQHADAGWCP